MPNVSFIIPCHNLGAYLDRTVQSVLKQRRKPFEILIVDDGSTDPATQHLFVSYQRPHTRVLRAERQGSAAAKNLGVCEASGDYIAFLETGDILDPEFLARLIEPLEADPSIAFAGCRAVEFDAIQLGRESIAWDLPHTLAGDRSWRAALIRKDILLAVNGLDRTIAAPEYDEWDLAITLAEHGLAGRLIPECLLSRGSHTVPCPMSRRQEDQVCLVSYIVDKHQERFCRHAPEVIRALEARIETLEARLPEAPERPLVEPTSAPGEDTADRWREAILALLLHRGRLEEQVAAMGRPGAPIAPGSIDWGDLRRLEPVSAVWGLDRGQPIDRHYIEQFLGGHRADIRGRVLEVKDPVYTNAFGAGVAASDIVDSAADNPYATLVCDLAVEGSLPEGGYDCFILTQTIHIIHEVDTVLRNAMRTLRPGGVLLATLPCASRVDYESGLEGDQWRFTPASARRCFEDVFGAGQVEIQIFGNVLTCCAFLMGVAAGELSPAELDRQDAYFPLLIGVRAVKAPSPEQPTNDRVDLSGQYPDAAGHNVSTLMKEAFMEEAFRIVAIVSAYNEGDIIASTIGHLIENGVDVYLIDNQSTDDTVAQASRWLGRGLLAIETFPDLAHPSAGRFTWGEILARKVALAQELQGRWFIHHDADEIRESPWPGATLRDAIQWVDRLGYNAIDFRLFNFRPVDDGFRPGMDPKTYFTRFEYAAEYDRVQLKCWRAGPAAIALADGGHEVRFEGRAVFPIPFILRHYPIRGQAHGRRKVFEERKGRFLESERAAGWHVQYDSIERADHVFLRNPASLLPFDIDRAQLDTMLSAHAQAEPLPESSAPEDGEGQEPALVEGFLDRASCRAMYGWAWDRNRPDVRLSVDIWDGDRLLGTVRADRFRQDLLNAGKGSGHAGFVFVPPQDLHAGGPGLIWANVAGTSRTLTNSPQPCVCTCQAARADQTSLAG